MQGGANPIKTAREHALLLSMQCYHGFFRNGHGDRFGPMYIGNMDSSSKACLKNEDVPEIAVSVYGRCTSLLFP